jgi:hypothetical protein
MTKWVMRIPDPNLSSQVPGGLACLDSEKAKALADNSIPTCTSSAVADG